MSKPITRHLLMDLWPKVPVCKSHTTKIIRIIEKYFQVVKRVRHRFAPIGETIVYILSSSHFSLHTFPEHNYISLDIYSCSKCTELKIVISEIKKAVPSVRYRIKQFPRGFE